MTVKYIIKITTEYFMFSLSHFFRRNIDCTVESNCAFAALVLTSVYLKIYHIYMSYSFNFFRSDLDCIAYRCLYCYHFVQL